MKSPAMYLLIAGLIYMFIFIQLIHLYFFEVNKFNIQFF